jgi:hypothetical protein
MGGSVVCWGLNDHGQVGDGSMTNRAAPTAVMSLSSVAEVAVGFAFACARHADGTLVGWGDNGHGQLGDGTTSATPRLAPGAAVLLINGINGATSVSAGHDHACARRTNSTVWCWGDNTYQQSNSTGGTPSNVDSSFTDALDVSVGDYHSCARRSTGGHVACWGDDDFLQLGSVLPSTSWPFPEDVVGIP